MNRLIRSPRVSLAVLSLAGALPDVTFFLIQFLGIETFNFKFDAAMAKRGCFPYSNDYPYSHSLAGMIGFGTCFVYLTTVFPMTRSPSRCASSCAVQEIRLRICHAQGHGRHSNREREPFSSGMACSPCWQAPPSCPVLRIHPTLSPKMSKSCHMILHHMAWGSSTILSRLSSWRLSSSSRVYGCTASSHLSLAKSVSRTTPGCSRSSRS